MQWPPLLDTCVLRIFVLYDQQGDGPKVCESKQIRILINEELKVEDRCVPADMAQLPLPNRLDMEFLENQGQKMSSGTAWDALHV